MVAGNYVYQRADCRVVVEQEQTLEPVEMVPEATNKLLHMPLFWS